MKIFPTRKRFVCFLAIALFVLLILPFLAGIAAERFVVSVMSEIDPAFDYATLSISPEIVCLTGIQMPGRSLDIDTLFLFWHGSLFNLSVDSLFIVGSVLELSASAVDKKSSERINIPENLKLILVKRMKVILPSDTLQLHCLLNRPDSDWRLFGQVQGKCGDAVFLYSESEDSLHLWLNNFNFVPLPGQWFPDQVSGHSYSGDLGGTFDESGVTLEGIINSIDDESVEISVTFRKNGSNICMTLSAGFSEVYPAFQSSIQQSGDNIFFEGCPSGSLNFQLMKSDTVHFNIETSLDSIRLYAQRISPDTLGFSAGLNCSGNAVLSDGRISVDSGTAFLDSARVDFLLEIDWREGNRYHISFWNDSLPGGILSRSIPRGALTNLNGLRLGGYISFFIDIVIDRNYPDSSDVRIELDASHLTVEYSPVSVGSFRYDGRICRMYDSWGNTQVIELDTLNNPDFLIFDSLPPGFEAVLCCAEDASFRTHNGFSISHIKNSLIANLSEGRFARGGSTITMQLARNLFLDRRKTLSRKLEEIFLTWRLERYLDKERILELYVNIVEWGPGIFGLNEAADYYFGIVASELTLRQSVYLISILPGPKLYHRFMTGNYIPDYWISYLDRLINITVNRGWISEEEGREALANPIVFNNSEYGTLTEMNL